MIDLSDVRPLTPREAQALYFWIIAWLFLIGAAFAALFRP